MNEIVATENPSMNQTRASDQKHCFSCGLLIHNSANSCPKCGAQQTLATTLVVQTTPSKSHAELPAANQVFCRGCGNVIHESATNCPRCGATQKTSGNVDGYSNEKSRVAAVVFAFLLGGIGGHKFYLGQVGMGFLYLIFFWTFIPAIIAFIEALVLLTMTDNEFARKYN